MALDACSYGRDPDRALLYVQVMRSWVRFRPSPVHYEKAIRAMVAAGKCRESYQLLADAVEVRGGISGAGGVWGLRGERAEWGRVRGDFLCRKKSYHGRCCSCRIAPKLPGQLSSSCEELPVSH